MAIELNYKVTNQKELEELVKKKQELKRQLDEVRQSIKDFKVHFIQDQS